MPPEKPSKQLVTPVPTPPPAPQRAAGEPAPPKAPAPPPSVDWMEQASTFLTSKGWTQVGVNEMGQGIWHDPRTREKPEVRVATTVPTSGGGYEEVRQLHVPCSPWDYTTEAALVIQKNRDADEAKKAAS